MIRAAFASSLVLVTLLVAAAARADDVAVAAETFRTGTAAYARGDYRAAAMSFEMSNKLAPHAVALYNAGLAWQAAGEGPRSADAYDLALGDGQLDDTQKADAKKRLVDLRGRLARLRITAPAGALITVDHVERAPAPRRVHVAPGSREVRVTFASGKEDARRVDATAGAETSVAFDEPADKPASPTAVAPVRTAPPAPTDASSSGGSTQRVLGFVAIGLGAAGIGVGAVTGAMALGARDDFEASGRRDADAHDRAATMRTLANVGFFAGGAVAFGGVVLVITAPSSTAAPRAALSLSPSGGCLHGRF